MQWRILLGAMLTIIVIIALQWPRLKQKPIQDKWAFFGILLISLVLSLFDLKHISGPSSWVEAIFKPLGPFMIK